MSSTDNTWLHSGLSAIFKVCRSAYHINKAQSWLYKNFIELN